MNNWRLLITPPSSGAWNMALDEAILEAIGRGEVHPTLRLFAWDPPCLSIGYAQPITDVDLIQLNDRGWGLVRRITGGRAILHTDELTYSVIGPAEDPILRGGVLESYQRISKALLSALQRLQIPAEALPNPKAPSGEHQTQEPVCFEVPSNYEITINGKKLIGSAQARKKVGVLQHGTLPLFGDLTRITQVLHFSDEEERTLAGNRLLERATTVESASDGLIPWDQAASAFQESFEEILGIHLDPASLTEKEISHTEELVKEKYAHPSWNERI